jgi:hypothetical protein
MNRKHIIIAAALACLLATLRPLLAGDPADIESLRADPGRLHRTLVERIARPDLERLRLDLGEGLSYAVVDTDDAGLFVTIPGAGDARIPWRWRDLGPELLLRLYDELPASPENLLDTAGYCLETGLLDEGHQRLYRLLERSPKALDPAWELLTRNLGIARPDEGFVFFDGRFVTNEARDQRLATVAEAWLLEKQAAEDERDARAEDLFERARRLSEKGFFLAGTNVMRKTAALAKGTALGIKAAELSRENGVLLVTPVLRNGSPDNRVDVFVLGDGYVLTDRAQGQFADLSKQLLDFFYKREVFAEYGSYFNFHRAHAWSKEDGVDTPTHDASTAFGGQWSGFAQGQVAVDGDLVTSALDLHAKGWDSALVMVRRGGGGTGGSRIAAFAHASSGIAFHEFGHSFGGLLDEYSTQVTKKPPTGPPPRGPNLSDTDDPDKVPWKHWLEAKTPGIGIYKGGAGRSDGVWHPSQSCVMGTGGNELCAVCRETFVLRIYERVRPVDELSHPEDRPILVDLESKEPILLEAKVLRPAEHLLETRWTLRGKPLPGGKRSLLADGRVLESISLDREELTLVSGYDAVLHLEVHDTTPWVIKDPHDLLRQTVSWRLRVMTDEERKRTRRTG